MNEIKGLRAILRANMSHLHLAYMGHINAHVLIFARTKEHSKKKLQAIDWKKEIVDLQESEEVSDMIQVKGKLY